MVIDKVSFEGQPCCEIMAQMYVGSSTSGIHFSQMASTFEFTVKRLKMMRHTTA
jgi:hypothetical protein